MVNVFRGYGDCYCVFGLYCVGSYYELWWGVVG